MKNLKSFSFLSIVFCFAIILSGCEGPAGEVGPAGPNGTNGTNGTNGVDGTDGNANVTVMRINKSTFTWTVGKYLGRPANVIEFYPTIVNQDIIDYGTVLGFCFGNSSWWPMPFVWENSTGSKLQHVTFTYKLNNITLYAYQTSGVLSPSIFTEYRFMLITDKYITSGGRISSDEGVLDRMKGAGVDINSYAEVCQYFDMDPN